MLVNAITKSGTNIASGSLSGYFRDDSFNAADHIQQRVLPYSNQQVSTTFGGPIRRDRIHFFANYEYEREPQTITFDSPYPEFNIDFPNKRQQHSGGGKGDIQFSPQIRLSTRVQVVRSGVLHRRRQHEPSVEHRSTESRHTTQFLTTFTQVIGNRAVNEIKGGTSRYTRINEPVSRWNGGNFPNSGTYSFRTGTATRVQLRGYTFGGGNVQHHNQYKNSIRDDFSVTYNTAGRHALRLGGEYIFDLSILRGCGSTCRPTLVAQGGAIPANIAQVLPVWNDASTWNLDLLAGVAQRYELSVTDTKAFYREIPQHLYAGWIQDDWTISSRLTVNLGVRWDLETGVGAKLALPPILPGDNPEDKNNFGPRVGFAYTLNDRTVVRGGYGKFFAEGTADEYHQTQLFIMSAAPQILNDGRPNFPTNPYNGPAPTLDQILSRSCDLNGSQAGLRPTGVRSRNGRSVLRDSLQPSGINRRTATARRQHVDREQLRVYGGASRGGLAQRQSELQPGYGRELRLPERGDAADARIWSHSAHVVPGPVQLSRLGLVVLEAYEQPVAGIRHLHAVELQRCRLESIRTRHRQPTP